MRTDRCGRPGRFGRWWAALALSAGTTGTVFGYVLQDAPRWPDGVVTFELQLGAAPQRLTDGSSSWDEPARAALDIWNARMGRLQLRGAAGSSAPVGQGNRRNNVFFADDAFGRDFGERTLAITFSSWTTGSRGGARTEADIVFNRGAQWDSYRGALKYRGGRSIGDLRRVALHEFGHALGLEHPDDEGQTVTAVMNATVSNLDTLAADDVTGVQELYGVRADTRGEPDEANRGRGRLINLSVRSQAGSGDRTLIAGFATTGGERTLLMRGIGPTLTELNVPDALPDPRLTLYEERTERGTNDNWGGSSTLSNDFARAGAFGLSPGSRDSALQRTLGAGRYSLHLTEAAGRRGVGLVEMYALGSDAGSGRLMNLSARTEVGTGASILIIGFVVGGDGPVRLLVRGVGPSLTEFQVNNVLVDPRLTVFRGRTVIAENDNWAGASAVAAAAQSTGAFPLSSNSRDAALVVELPPGSYTAQVNGVGDTTGVALVELYLLP